MYENFLDTKRVTLLLNKTNQYAIYSREIKNKTREMMNIYMGHRVIFGKQSKRSLLPSLKAKKRKFEGFFHFQNQSSQFLVLLHQDLAPLTTPPF